MELLKREEVDKVDPKFRPMVIEAFDKGEEVPYSVVYLSSEPITEKDIEWVKTHLPQFFD
jgi:hypothetical protein